MALVNKYVDMAGEPHIVSTKCFSTLKRFCAILSG